LVVDTGGNLPPASLTPVPNLPPVSTILVKLVANLPPVSLTLEYLREFLKKIETVIMGYSGTGGKLIHEKNQMQKIL
jgi:hypothetical protein